YAARRYPGHASAILETTDAVAEPPHPKRDALPDVGEGIRRSSRRGA
ncbi:MAG: hypothetical protein JWQ39_1769, partial [Glaciihabitans sp.]|nr:hypothetical protein [Glaciihabitans sp.]